jgi:tRNA threonylcarbamoyladenosine biosynthesis protein TsaE
VEERRVSLEAEPWTSRSADETERAGAALGHALATGDLVALEGPLGAGKSRLVAGIARGLDSRTAVRSPTFTLVNQYAGRVTLFHVDLYRLEPDEVGGLGLDECREQGALAVEWGEKLPAGALAEALRLRIEARAGDERIFHAAAEPGTRGAELLLAWRSLTRAPAARG